MAINQGKDGYVRLSSENVAHINTWELNIAADALEITSFSDGWDRTYVPGLRGPTATFSGYYEDTDTGQYKGLSYLLSTGTPTTVTARLLYYRLLKSATSTWYNGFAGTAVITGMTLGSAVEGVQTISGNLQFDGGIHTTAHTS